MPAIEVRPGIYWIGVNDRTTDLFEGLWPITREGVSYNAYLVDGERKALIDLAKGLKTDEFLEQMAEVVAPGDLDFIVVNHMEPDHTGILRTLRAVAPQAEILCTRRAVEMLASYYRISERVRAVEDQETLHLGSHTLQFFHTPFVHWPETMMTYETGQKVLFACDGFGGYGALQGAIFDDQYDDLTFYEQESLRYYANIVASFSKPVLKAIDRLSGVPFEVIAPSHGLIWRRNPGRIVELYRQWAGYADGAGEPGVTLLYGSMYGNSERFANAVAQGVSQAGVPVEMFDVTHTHVSYILSSLWVKQGVIVCAPTYETALFPPMVHVLDMAERKRIVKRRAAYCGSYGWSSGGDKEFARLAEALKWEVVESFIFRGGPGPEQLKEGEAFGQRFAQRLI